MTLCKPCNRSYKNIKQHFKTKKHKNNNQVYDLLIPDVKEKELSNIRLSFPVTMRS